MPSPLPGMDPYLEDPQIWPIFHHQLIVSLYRFLQVGLTDRYKARMSERHYVTQQALLTTVVHDDHCEELIEIRQRGENRAITLIEVVSPANRTTIPGRNAYLARRQEARAAGASLVEVDLVLQGRAMVDYSREGLPEWNYAVIVTRSTRPDRYEIYPATMRKRLPRFRLPLANDDRDLSPELQDIFNLCYDQAGFGGKVDYRRDPITVLNTEDRTWLHDLLVQQNLR